MDDERRAKLALLMTNYVQLTPTGPYKFTIVESRRHRGGRMVGFRENMDIKFLRPHEIIASVDTAEGGVHAVANGSEAKIADIAAAADIGVGTVYLHFETKESLIEAVVEDTVTRLKETIDRARA